MQIARTIRITRSVLVAFIAVVFVTLNPLAAVAERDHYASGFVRVNGTIRAESVGYIDWGSGIRWTVRAEVWDYREDNHHVTVEVKLNRQGSSNTPWMKVAATYGGNGSYGYNSLSGMDPTYGAWLRTCIWPNPGGNGYCSSPVYFADNS